MSTEFKTLKEAKEAVVRNEESGLFEIAINSKTYGIQELAASFADEERGFSAETLNNALKAVSEAQASGFAEAEKEAEKKKKEEAERAKLAEVIQPLSENVLPSVMESIAGNPEIRIDLEKGKAHVSVEIEAELISGMAEKLGKKSLTFKFEDGEYKASLKASSTGSGTRAAGTAILDNGIYNVKGTEITIYNNGGKKTRAFVDGTQTPLYKALVAAGVDPESEDEKRPFSFPAKKLKGMVEDEAVEDVFFTRELTDEEIEELSK